MKGYRRSLLASGCAVIGIGISGCLDDSDESKNNVGGNGDVMNEEVDADDDGVPDGLDDFPNDPDRSTEETVRGNVDVSEDEWYRWEYDFDDPTHVEYEIVVRDGPALDFIFFDKSEYFHYENQNRAKYDSLLSDLETTRGTGSGWVDQGNYVLVIDNTSWGEARPPTNLADDVAEVEYTISTSR